MSRGYLILANGRVFEGERFGADTDSTGELVFTTGAGAYVETLTDPCYCGQIIMQTFPLIGNYGWISGDTETDSCAAAGYIVRDWCDAPSNFRCEGDIDAYLKAQGVPGLYGVDTREIAQIIREEGVMPACISSTPEVDMAALRGYAVKGAVERTAPSGAAVYPAEGEKKYSVTVISCGAPGGVVDVLNKYGCEVTVLPCTADADAILSAKPDGIVLSDGPGDPAENTAAVEVIKAIVGKVPVFGYGLGHQLLALAMGGRTGRLKFGHRGANQPVKELSTGRVVITSQNHGYAVDADSVTGAEVTYINLNDSTCEGLEYTGSKAFSVQFRPEACYRAGSSLWLFDKLIAMMGGNN